MRRLALGLPTVYQSTSEYALLFNGSGVTKLERLGDRMSYLAVEKLKNRIWALIDLNPALPKPSPLFAYQSPFFVVNAMSPHSEHSDLVTTASPRMFYMTPWSISEVLQAYVDLTSRGPQHSHFL